MARIKDARKYPQSIYDWLNGGALLNVGGIAAKFVAQCDYKESARNSSCQPITRIPGWRDHFLSFSGLFPSSGSGEAQTQFGKTKSTSPFSRPLLPD